MARQRLLNLEEFHPSLRQHKLRHLHSPSGLVADHLSMGRTEPLGLAGLRLSLYQTLRRWKLQYLSHNVADLARKGNVQRSLRLNPNPPQKANQALRLYLLHPNHAAGRRRRRSAPVSARQNPRQKLMQKSKSNQQLSLQSKLAERLVSLEERASLSLFIVSPTPLLWVAGSLLPIPETNKTPPTSYHHASGPRCPTAAVSILQTYWARSAARL
jgi:hypothetical protein